MGRHLLRPGRCHCYEIYRYQGRYFIEILFRPVRSAWKLDAYHVFGTMWQFSIYLTKSAAGSGSFSVQLVRYCHVLLEAICHKASRHQQAQPRIRRAGHEPKAARGQGKGEKSYCSRCPISLPSYCCFSVPLTPRPHESSLNHFSCLLRWCCTSGRSSGRDLKGKFAHGYFPVVEKLWFPTTPTQ